MTKLNVDTLNANQFDLVSFTGLTIAAIKGFTMHLKKKLQTLQIGPRHK